MEILAKQRRVRFSERTEEPRSSFSWPSESSLTDNCAVNWVRSQLENQTKEEQYDPKESELATTVAVAAFAIDLMEEIEAEKRRKQREDLERRRVSKPRIRKPDDVQTVKQLKPEGKTVGRSSTQEVEIADESLGRKLAWQENREQEIASSSRRSRMGFSVSKADSWERSQIEKIRRRHEKMRTAIVAWENQKKLAARLKMQREKSELEKRKEINQQHYRMRLSDIENISGGAKEQLEEKKRNDEARVRERAKRMRRTGKVPISCFGFHFS